MDWRRDIYRRLIFTYKNKPRAERVESINPYSAGRDFSRQNLTSVDVRF